MPEITALILLFLLFLVGLATGRFKAMPFLALLAAQVVLGVALGSTLPWVGKEMTLGFGQSIAATGLAIVGGYMLSRAMTESGAGSWLREKLPVRWQSGSAMILGALAGLGGNPIAALAVLTPISEAAGRARSRVALAATHAVTAFHGCVLPSPLPIAALAILGGDFLWCLKLGIPVALVQIAIGMILARSAPDHLDDSLMTQPSASARGAGALVVGILIMTGLIIGNSLGQMPTEPFGGGNIRETLLGLGRPVIVLIAGLTGALVIAGTFGRQVWTKDGWLAEGARNSVGILLAVGVTGGLQTTLFNTGMAVLLAEKMQALPMSLGIVLPFLLAFVCRALQGSALTAVITGAGLMQPLLTPLGLDQETGRALTCIALGAGAMAIPHLNDGFFWLAAEQAALKTGTALIRVTAGSLAQGAAALAVLMVLAYIL